MWQTEIRGFQYDTEEIKNDFKSALEVMDQYPKGISTPISEIQYIERGSKRVPLATGPDVLNAVYSGRSGQHLYGMQGDSNLFIVDFAKNGVKAQGIHNFGSSNRPKSPHYSDQSELFAERKLRPILLKRSDIIKTAERAYRPAKRTP